jgi:hypothetical protein
MDGVVAEQGMIRGLDVAGNCFIIPLHVENLGYMYIYIFIHI